MTADGTQITLNTPKVYKRWLRTQAGQWVTVIVERMRKRRSHQQNAYWWAVVVPLIGEKCGYLPSEYDAVHDELMRVLVGLRPDCHPALKIRVSSTALSTLEFNRLIEDAQVWAAETLQLEIPDPDPEWAFRKAAPDGRTTTHSRQPARHH